MEEKYIIGFIKKISNTITSGNKIIKEIYSNLSNVKMPDLKKFNLLKKPKTTRKVPHTIIHM